MSREISTTNFTKIPNDLIEVLLNSALNDSQRRILFFVARKTYGFNKETDKISWSQFQNKLNISRGTLSSSLNRLKLVHLLVLVSIGKSKISSNEWQINVSDYQDKLVRLTKLVQFGSKKLVRKPSDTKESITKQATAAGIESKQKKNTPPCSPIITRWILENIIPYKKDVKNPKGLAKYIAKEVLTKITTDIPNLKLENNSTSARYVQNKLGWCASEPNSYKPFTVEELKLSEAEKIFIALKEIDSLEERYDF
jgi:phage replication O-like protein O